jgi:hypothetical protein
MWEMRSEYRNPFGKARGKRQLEAWEDNIEVDLTEVWTGLVWPRVATGGGLL